MILMAKAGIIKQWNASAQETFGYTAEEVIGQNITMLMPEPYKSNHGKYLERYLQTGEKRVVGKRRDVPVITKDGREITCTLKASIMRESRDMSGLPTMCTGDAEPVRHGGTPAVLR